MKLLLNCIIITLVFGQINWNVEIVDSLDQAGGCGSRCALFVDNNDTPHVVYSYHNPNPPDSGYGLMYAVKAGSTWIRETLDSNIAIAYLGPSLGIDQNGTIHVSYYARNIPLPAKTRLCYACKDSTDWHHQILDSLPCILYSRHYTSLAFDTAYNPGIAYACYDSEDFHIKYAHYNSVDWDFLIVDSNSPYEEVGPSLEFDNNSNPHIAYYYRSALACSVKYSYHDGSQWFFIWGKDIYSPNGDENLDLALNSQGYAHIAYGEGVGLRYAYYDGISWHTESGIGGGFYKIRMDLDALELPHIVSTSQGGGPYYIYRDSTQWHSCGSVDTTADNRQGLGLMFDSNFNPHVIFTYYHTPYIGLKYATTHNIGIKEGKCARSLDGLSFITIINGPLILPEGKKCRIFDITGREIKNVNLTPGVYFIQVDGQITNKVIKIR